MITKFKIGEKIKIRRKKLNLTQQDVCSSFMTRNMLSLIEKGKATPSLETLVYLSEKLDLPISYILSEGNDLFPYEKEHKLEDIKKLFAQGNYEDCAKSIESLSGGDDEINLIYAISAFEIGKKALLLGSLATASKYINRAVEASQKTVYPTDEINVSASLYLAVASNVQSPLLEFDKEEYEKLHSRSFDYEFYKYISLDTEYAFENNFYKMHLTAKSLIKKYKFYEAIELLTQIEDAKNKFYNAPMLFGVYTDLELAYKQLGDFEKAYRYSTKRISLLNAFTT